MNTRFTAIPFAILLAAGCSSDDNKGSGTTGGGTSLTTSGGAKATGGTKSTAGGASVGGNKSTGGASFATGGATGVAATGGTQSTVPGTTGGAMATGGAQSLGGATATGGTTALASSGLGGTQPTTGGASTVVVTTGGTHAAGGASAIGGATHTGGTTPGTGTATTGGTTHTGGATSTGTTGGATATGGTSATVGGTTSTGGATAGGTTATAGGTTATGGTATTGGSTATETIGVVSGPAPATYWQTVTVSTVTDGTADVTVDDSSPAQTWEGFGGSFNEMGWNQLTTAALQTEAIELLFGTNGTHFVIGRVPMGASDYAMDRYTLDDTGTDVIPDATESNRPPADPTLAQFSVTRDTIRLIPYIQSALSVNPTIRLWASPWTPPVWMKTGYKTNSGAPSGGNAVRPSYFDGGYMKSDTTTLNAHAQYFVKFIKAYQERGLTIETVAPQNEPNYDQNYPSCLWDAATYTSFVKILGPALAAASLNTKIMLGTMSNSNASADPAIVTAVMGDTTASGLVSSIGVQWGMTANVGSYRSSYGLPIWVTEHRCGNYPWQTSTYVSERAPNDQAYAVESWGYIRDAIKAGVTAYNAWNMVLDPIGKGIDMSRDWAQNSLLIVENGAIVKTPAYYVFRHVSQYVQPGAKIVATAGTSAADTLAFKNPNGSVVAVMYNSGTAKTSIIQIAGKKLQVAVPQSGWATVVSP